MTEADLTVMTIIAFIKKLIRPIVHDMVDDRLHIKLVELDERPVSSTFDIQDHAADIVAIFEAECDIDSRIADQLSECTFTTTVD